MEDGIITKVLLKTRSGEFDLESIHSLSLRELGISDLGCISECASLERLNLARNDISKLTKLAGLNNLTQLNLSANRIVSLEGLQSLESLQHLNLAGNLIGSIDSLRCLTGLDKLKTLRLCDRTHDLSNPVCMNKSYRTDMISMFPNLEWLDGEKLIGRGSEVFQLCQKIEEALEARQESESLSHLPKPSKWVPDEYWEPSNKFEESILSDASEELEALLMSCKYSVKKSEDTLNSLKESSKS
ncbi:Leucine-rich repeat-containing protein 61 [Mytilus coruscus]|uniref:Leucine-rich repeat-containing protein 61 n=1 Tax=Mytilus coruscus TaxID=42192 RepID=A0A6J8F3W1_MYTCO|nr:Leucine-rich repeat-containing protein 61 [Mytilus coruscus]